MTLALRLTRGVTTLVALAVLTAFNAARANHFILPCRDDCTGSRWVRTASLNFARFAHTATLLQDGRVLIVGGYGKQIRGNGPILDSAELYDPAAGTWSVTGQMSRPRVGHTATLLRDGRVLVAGGGASQLPPDFGRTDTAELYDPATGTWSPTGGMGAIRDGHAATRLQDGRVLVAGGYASDTLKTAELYDPGTGTWSTTGDLNVARYWHTMTLLQDGTVLAVRGSDEGDLNWTLSSAELYDADSGTWRVVGDSGRGSVHHTATLLPNGKVLVTGGTDGRLALAASDLFDPAARTWRGAGDLFAPRFGHTATLLATGDVLVTGGQSQIGKYPDLQHTTEATTERFDPATATWNIAADLNVPRLHHTATLLSNGSLLAAGGNVVSSSWNDIQLASAELHVPARKAVPFDPGLPTDSAAANYQGMWVVPGLAEAGWGISVAHQSDLIFASWFTYDASGRPSWLTMTAQRRSDGSFTGTIDRTTGPPFSAVPFDPSRVSHTTVGTGWLTFESANNGTFAYTVNGVSQTKALTRFQFATPVPVCTFNSPLTPAQATNYQDMWVVPGLAEAGWGINFAHQGSAIFASWFTYDESGSPYWVTATLTKTGAQTYTGALDETTGPPLGAEPFDPSRVSHRTVGTVTVTFTDGNNATFAYTMNGVSQSKALTRFVFHAPGTVCDAPGDSGAGMWDY